MEVIQCNDCGCVAPNEGYSEVSASDFMDELEAGELDWEEYQSALGETRFACPSCCSLNTEVSGC